jgi:hypothetical protein
LSFEEAFRFASILSNVLAPLIPRIQPSVVTGLWSWVAWPAHHHSDLKTKIPALFGEQTPFRRTSSPKPIATLYQIPGYISKYFYFCVVNLYDVINFGTLYLCWPSNKCAWKSWYCIKCDRTNSKIHTSSVGEHHPVYHTLV